MNESYKSRNITNVLYFYDKYVELFPLMKKEKTTIAKKKERKKKKEKRNEKKENERR